MHGLAGPVGQPGVALSDVTVLWYVSRHHASLSSAACGLVLPGRGIPILFQFPAQVPELAPFSSCTRTALHVNLDSREVTT